jgi:hypothetical protein
MRLAYTRQGSILRTRKKKTRNTDTHTHTHTHTHTERERERERERESGHVQTEATFGVLQVQAKGGVGLLVGTRARVSTLPRNS